MLDVVLPLKTLSTAKSRLASVLSSEQRQALTVAMASDVIETVLRWPQTNSLSVIAGEGWQDLLTAWSQAKVQVVKERVLEENVPGAGDPASHLNCAVNAALANLKGAVLVIHGDLPWLSGPDLNLMTEALHAGNDAVLAADRHGSGTNLMAFTSAANAICQFGTGSYERHRALLTKAGLAYKSVSAFGLSHDLDTPEDLALLTSSVLCNDGAEINLGSQDNQHRQHAELATHTEGRDASVANNRAGVESEKGLAPFAAGTYTRDWLRAFLADSQLVKQIEPDQTAAIGQTASGIAHPKTGTVNTEAVKPLPRSGRSHSVDQRHGNRPAAAGGRTPAQSRAQTQGAVRNEVGREATGVEGCAQDETVALEGRA